MKDSVHGMQAAHNKKNFLQLFRHLKKTERFQHFGRFFDCMTEMLPCVIVSLVENISFSEQIIPPIFYPLVSNYTSKGIDCPTSRNVLATGLDWCAERL